MQKEQHLTTEHIPLQDSVEVQSVCSWFLSTLSFWLYYSLLSKTPGMNKCIIGVIYLGGWVKRIVYSWLHHSVSAPVSDRLHLPQWKDKVLEQSDLIHLEEVRCRHNLVTTAFSQACCRLTATKKKTHREWSGCLSVTVCPLPLEPSRKILFAFRTQASCFSSDL